MRVLGNVLWHFPFFGFATAILTYLLGLFLTVTVVAAPIGLGLMEHGKFLFAPFSRAMVSKADIGVEQNALWKTYSFLIMLLYLPIGLVLALVSVLQVALLFASIIGIPAAIVVAKSIGTYFNPVHKKCVHRAVAAELEAREARAEVARYLGPT